MAKSKATLRFLSGSGDASAPAYTWRFNRLSSLWHGKSQPLRINTNPSFFLMHITRILLIVNFVCVAGFSGRSTYLPRQKAVASTTRKRYTAG